MLARWLAAVVVVLLLGAAGCQRARSAGPAPGERPTAVRVVVTAVEEVAEHRRLSGDVTPWEVLPLSFKVGGRVARLFVEEGDQVKAGQLVAVLDSRDYKLVHQLAETQVTALEPHLGRAEKLRAEAALPQAQLDELKSKMSAARIQQQQARAQLSYSALHAPMAGVVLQKRVASGDLVDPTRPVVVIADLRRVKVVLPVPQGDLGHFRKDLPVELVLPGLERRLRGVVHQLGFAADPKTRTFPVTLSVPNPDLALRAGMVVEAQLVVARHRGLLLPLDAISRDVVGGPRVLVVGAGGRAESRSVELGPVLGERALIARGLRVGERVIVQGMAAAGDLVVVSEGERPR